MEQGSQGTRTREPNARLREVAPEHPTLKDLC